MPSRDSQSRREQILTLAASSGAANVEELARRFGVTASTIRRDLARLSQTGRLARTYGGAISLVEHQEHSLRQRLGEEPEAKRAIARWAAGQVAEGDRIYLDAGSSVAALAHELREGPAVTATTVSLTAISELADATQIEVECLGGHLRRMSQGLVGPITEAALERMTFDAAFLGTDGISAGLGLCEADLDQTRLKELVASRASRVYVLAHGAKVGAAPFHAWARIRGPWTLVTDDSADPQQLALFEGTDTQVIVVPTDPDAAVAAAPVPLRAAAS